MTSGEDIPIDDIALLQLFKDNLLNSTLSTASGDHSSHSTQSRQIPSFNLASAYIAQPSTAQLGT